MNARSRGRTSRPAARPSRTRRRDWRRWAVAVSVLVIAAGVLVAILLNQSSSSGGAANAPAARANASAAGAALTEIKTPDFHSMAISSADPQLALYGHHGGVLRSTDGGRTWANTNLTGNTDDAMGMGISMTDPNLAFAAGHNTFFRSTKFLLKIFDQRFSTVDLTLQRQKAIVRRLLVLLGPGDHFFR